MKEETTQYAQDKPFKVETKGSLFEVTLEQGEYSDWTIYYLVFSGNSQEEVWEFLKIYLQHSDQHFEGPVNWEGRRYKNGASEDDYHPYEWDVTIKRLDVIYVNPRRRSRRKTTPQ